MQGIVDTLVNVYNAIIFTFLDFFGHLKSYFNATLQSLLNVWNMIVDFYSSAFQAIANYFPTFWGYLVVSYDSFLDYLDSVWRWIKSFFKACGVSFENFAHELWMLPVNIIKSLYFFLIDLPSILLVYLFEAFEWLLGWAYDSCSTCFGAGSDAASALPSAMSSIWSSLSPTVLYCVQQSGVQTCLQLLTCALIVWAVVKELKMLWGAIF